MAGNDTVCIAIDGSEFSEQAFNCKYHDLLFYTLSISIFIRPPNLGTDKSGKSRMLQLHHE